jgi:hypothetical protein
MFSVSTSPPRPTEAKVVMSVELKKGDRVRITKHITPGIGAVPPPGATGTVAYRREDETVLVELDDGRRGLFAPWELEYVGD